LTGVGRMCQNQAMRSKNSPIVQESPPVEAPPAESQSFIEAARRKQIVQSAIETIASLGYGRASLAEIAKHAGISKSIISYHFANKDELIRQVVIDVYTAGAEFMYPRMLEQDTITGQLRAYIETNVAFMAANRTSVLALVEIVAGHRMGTPNSPFNVEGGREIQADLEALLQRGKDSGEFRDFSVPAVAFATRAVIDMLPPYISLNPDTDLEQYAKELADLFDLATRQQK
jgi:TetR/AcrR family fatty acid metabolism transcriptional regulator